MRWVARCPCGHGAPTAFFLLTRHKGTQVTSLYVKTEAEVALPTPSTSDSYPTSTTSQTTTEVASTPMEDEKVSGKKAALTAATASETKKLGRRSRERLFTWPLLIGMLITLGLITASLLIGVYDIFHAEDGLRMFMVSRVPRTASLVLAGAGLAMAGLVMQLITQNRFVEPTTVGTTEWAGLGLLLAYIFFPSSSVGMKMVMAIICAFVGTLVFFAFLSRVTLRSSIIVPIVGMMLGAVVGAFSTLIALSTNLSQTMTIWFTGTFSTAVQGQYEPLWFLIFVVVAIFICADRFTVAGLGEDVATNVGLNYRGVVLLGNFLIALITGIVTVVIGNLPFLGLIVPNLVALVRGDDLRSNLPWVALGGVWVLIICDLVGRTIIMPYEIPASSILSILGAAVFITLLLRQRRRQK